MTGPSVPRTALFVLNSLAVGGSERKTIRLVNQLQQAGWRNSIAYLNGPDTLRPQIVGAIPVVNLARRGKFSLRALLTLRRHLQVTRPAVVVAVNLYAGLYAALATRLATGSPSLWIAVNTTEFHSAGERRQMLLYRWILRMADGVIFGARSQMELWEQRYKLRQPRLHNFVLYNGIDEQLFQPDVTPRLELRPAGVELVLGTVGRMRPEKAHVDLVRAIAGLRRRGLNVGALLVGDGPERVVVEHEAQRLGVSDVVRITGETTDVQPYLAAMDAFVLTSVAVETFSNAALEAMAMGKPIVSARIGGMPEMLEGGVGWLYPPGDVPQLCAVLEPLLRDPPVLRAAGRRARELLIERFSLRSMAATFEQHLPTA